MGKIKTDEPGMGTAAMGWLSENPELTNMGMGFLKSLQEEKRQKADAADQIAKTQYGYLLNQGVGDMQKVGRETMSDRLMQGYISGAATRQGNEMNEAIKDMLTSKAASDKAGAVSKLTNLGPIDKSNSTESAADAINFADVQNKLRSVLGPAPQSQYAVDFNANPAPSNQKQPIYRKPSVWDRR